VINRKKQIGQFETFKHNFFYFTHKCDKDADICEQRHQGRRQKAAVPQENKQYGKKGWLFAILARILKDEGVLESG
jgi:hypothetical protein